jgi:hypothetical protein
MGTRTEALAAQFEAAVADFAKTIEEVPDDKWSAVGGPEGWTIAGLAQHVSGQFPLEHEYIAAAAEGLEAPAYSWDDINGKNDSRAAKNSQASKADVLAELNAGAAQEAAYIRAMSEDQLDRKLKLPLAGGAEVTTEQLILGGVLIEHVTGHNQSVRSAL